MECYHCGQENDDEAVYCKLCGLRVDGKKECPSCNKLVDSDSQFCGYCGHNLQEESVEEIDEKSEIQDEEQPSIKRASEFKPHLRKANEIGIGVFSMATVFFSLLFVFFVGLKTYSVNMTDYDAYLGTKPNINLFYYLGECYSNIAAIDKTFPSYYIANFKFIAAMGTILSVAIMTLVVAFSIISVVRYVNYSAGRSEKSYSTPVFATYASFIIGVTLFYAFNVMSGQYSSMAVSVKLNEYTVAGVALSTVFMILTTICKTATLGRLLSTPQNLYKMCFSILSLILLAFMAVLVASPSMTMKNSSGVSMSYNFFYAMSTLVTIAASKETNGSYAREIISSSATDSGALPEIIYTQFVILFLMQIAMIIITILMIVTLLKNVSDKDKQGGGKNLIISIVMSVMSIVYLIVTANAGNDLLDYTQSSSDDISFSVLPLILLVIVCVINLAIQIIHTVTHARLKQQLE